MIVKLLNPQGYCKGVSNALDKIDKALLDSSLPRPIYLLGEIIHNQYIIDFYKKKGVILLPEGDKTKEEYLDEIETGTIIFQAHGSSPEAFDIATKKKLRIIDATCPYVNLIHKRIIDYHNNGYTIIYIGKKNHAETIASLKQVKNTNLVSTLEDINNLNIKSDKIYVTNQTTLSTIDLKTIFTKIKEKYPKAIIDNKICDATTKRQLAVINQPTTDLCIVVGDKASSNSKRLFELASKKQKAIFVNCLADLKNYEFNNVRSVSITSGASTPFSLVLEIKEFLESLP